MDPDQNEEGLLAWLDTPRLVVGAAIMFLLGLTLLGIVLWSDLQEHTERLDQIVSEREAELRAANEAQVNECFSRAAAGPELRNLLLAIRREMKNEDTRRRLLDYAELNELQAPTLKECRQLADRLNISVPKGIR